jgi:hypothetical protein
MPKLIKKYDAAISYMWLLHGETFEGVRKILTHMEKEHAKDGEYCEFFIDDIGNCYLNVFKEEPDNVKEEKSAIQIAKEILCSEDEDFAVGLCATLMGELEATDAAELDRAAFSRLEALAIKMPSMDASLLLDCVGKMFEANLEIKLSKDA